MISKVSVSMDVRTAAPSVSVIDIRGEINTFAENILMDSYTKANSQGAQSIILNFEGLDYMNSGGIGLLVTLLIRAQRQGQRLLACGLNEHYRQIFELTRLNEAIGIYHTESEAVAAARAGGD